MITELGEKLYTVEEFLNLNLPDDDDNEYELIRGRLVAKPKGGVSGEHGDMVARITTELNVFAGVRAGEKSLGKVYSGASSNLGLSQGRSYVEPDVCFVLKDRTPPKFKGPIPVAPDLVIEVWSPSDTTEKIQNKIEAYLEAGVRLIWSVYLLSKFVLVYRLNEPDLKLLNLKDELDGEDVIPGFKVAVRNLFE